MIQPSASAPEAPTEIGPYRILDTLGQGGMGVVYKAEHFESHERVALKTVRVLFPSELASIRAEIVALTRLRHPGVVRILGGGVDEGKPWYTMELLLGRTLQDYLREVWRPFRDALTARIVMRETAGQSSIGTDETTLHPRVDQTMESYPDHPLPGPSPARPPDRTSAQRWPVAGGRLLEVLTLVRRLCAPLTHIHGHGMVHRDLKPGNVFIRPDGTPVLMDFGLVSRFRGAFGRERLEVAGPVMGTAAYIAPEQVRGQFVDARADLYALGCILYEMLAGRVPFQAPTTVEVLYQHLDTPPERVSEHVDGVPPQLDDVVARLLAKRPGDRIGYAEDLAALLVQLGAQDAPPDASSADAKARAYLYRPELQGRMELVADLARRFDGVREGRGGFALVGGESGVGKTFLAAEAARQAGGRKLRVVVGECLPLATTEATAIEMKEAPLHPFRGLLLTMADVCREKGQVVTERVLGRRGKVLAAYERTLAGLPGQDAQPDPPDLPAEDARRRVFDDLAETLGAFAHETPLLFIIDDLQWADDLTMGFLRYLPADFFTRHPVFVLGTYRAEEAAPEVVALRERPFVHHIELSRLDENTVGAIAAGMLAMPSPPDKFVHVLARLTEGNPFFVAEYLRTAVDEGLLVREAGQWKMRESTSGVDSPWEALALPRSLRALVARRLSGLSATAARLAEAAAVIGREVELPLLVAVSGVPERDVLETMQELMARQVLEPADAGGFRFVHDKLREIAAVQLGETRRKELHRAAAKAIEAQLAGGASVPPSLLAYHFRESESWAKAIDYLEKAADQALAAFSNREAQAYTIDALQLADRLPAPGVGPLRLGRLEGVLVESHWRMGEHVPGRTHGERALAHFARPMPHSAAGFALGLLKQVMMRILGAWLPSLLRPRRPLERALTAEAANVFNRMFDALLWNNEPLPAIYCGLRGVNLAEMVEPSKALARGYALLSVIVATTPLHATARAWARRSIELAEKLGDPTTQSYCLGRISGIAVAHGDITEGLSQVGSALAVARETRNHRAIEECTVLTASYLAIEGRFSESLEQYRQTRASGADRGDGQTQSWGRSGMAQALARLGREEEALAILDEDMGWLERSGLRLEVTWASAARALAELQRGELDKARAAADRAIEWMQRERVVGYMWHGIVVMVGEVYLGLWEARADGGPAEVKPIEAHARKAGGVLAGFSKAYPFAVPSSQLMHARTAYLRGHAAEAERSAGAALLGAQKVKLRFEEAQAYALLAAIGGPEPDRQRARAEELFAAIGCTRELLRLRMRKSSTS